MVKKKKFKYAIIDIETRWNSLYNMLFRLLELKDFFQEHDDEHPDLILSDSEWDSIQSIVSSDIAKYIV